MAVVADAESRWSRVKKSYKSGRHAFVADDARDRGGQGTFSQQVSKCVGEADAVVVNDEDVVLDDFQSKVVSWADVLTGSVERHASWDEILMHQAFSSSHASKCLKRHVGAVLVNARNDVVGCGYNENPYGMNPCVEEAEYENECFRDRVRNQAFEQLSQQGVD